MGLGVEVGVLVGVGVEVGVLVGVGVQVGVGVAVGVSVGVAVGVLVGVFIGVGVDVSVGASVGVDSGAPHPVTSNAIKAVQCNSKLWLSIEITPFRADSVKFACLQGLSCDDRQIQLHQLLENNKGCGSTRDIVDVSCGLIETLGQVADFNSMSPGRHQSRTHNRQGIGHKEIHSDFIAYYLMRVVNGCTRIRPLATCHNLYGISYRGYGRSNVDITLVAMGDMDDFSILWRYQVTRRNERDLNQCQRQA